MPRINAIQIGMQDFATASSAVAAAGQIVNTASMLGRVSRGAASFLGGANADAITSAQQGLQRANSRVASAQSQVNFAREQAAATYPKGGMAYSGWNAQQVGAESARLQMGIHNMNTSIGRLSDLRQRLMTDGMSKNDPVIKSLNRKIHKLNTQIGNDGMKVKYLGLRNAEINAEHNLAQAQLEESFARLKLNGL